MKSIACVEISKSVPRVKITVLPFVVTALALVILALAQGSAVAAITYPLQPLTGNSHYFSSNGFPEIIVGCGSLEPAKTDQDFYASIPGLATNGSNWVRFFPLATWETQYSDSTGYTPAPLYWPWKRTGGPGGNQVARDGGLAFDLTQLDTASATNYFTQLSAACNYACQNNTYAEVMLFDNCSIKGGTWSWNFNPFNPANNVNGLGLNSGAGDHDGRDGFYTLGDVDSALFNIQKAFVDYTLASTTSCPNVAYLTCNEFDGTDGALSWEAYWTQYLRANAVYSGTRRMVLVNNESMVEPAYWSASGIGTSNDMVTFHMPQMDTSGDFSTDYLDSGHCFTQSFYGSGKPINFDETPEPDSPGVMTPFYDRGVAWGSFTGGGQSHIEDLFDAGMSTARGLRAFIGATGGHYAQMQPLPRTWAPLRWGGGDPDHIYALANTGTAAPEYAMYFTEKYLDDQCWNLVEMSSDSALPVGNTYHAFAYNPYDVSFTPLTTATSSTPGDYTFTGVPANQFTTSEANSASTGDVVVYISTQGFLTGNITLQNYVAPIFGMSGYIQIQDTAGNLIESRRVTLDSAGNYLITHTRPQGTYVAACKFSHWLAQAVPMVVGSNGMAAASFSLLNGDINGDNVVEDQDYSLLGVAWYTGLGDPKYNIEADLNGDGFVEDQDYSIMGLNWYKSGGNWDSDASEQSMFQMGQGMSAMKPYHPIPPCPLPNHLGK
jgi:hypothetical protein